MSRRAGTSSKYSTADSDPLEAPTEHLNKAKKKRKIAGTGGFFVRLSPDEWVPPTIFSVGPEVPGVGLGAGTSSPVTVRSPSCEFQN